MFFLCCCFFAAVDGIFVFTVYCTRNELCFISVCLFGFTVERVTPEKLQLNFSDIIGSDRP